MTSRWIVSSHRFREHKSLEAAEEEKARLSAAMPWRAYRVMRVKPDLTAGKVQALIARMRMLLMRARAAGTGDPELDDEIEAVIAATEHKPAPDAAHAAAPLRPAGEDRSPQETPTPALPCRCMAAASDHSAMVPAPIAAAEGMA